MGGGEAGADPAGPDRAAVRARGGTCRCVERVGGISRLTAVTGFWPIFFLLVVLKIPVLGSIWLVWWASREPEPETADGPEGERHPRRPQPKLPRAPRRGPHGGGAAAPGPACPPGGRIHVVKP